jgi:hypothetical protein
MPKLLIDDFSGGITDTPFNSPANCGQRVDNLYIGKDKTLETVPGIEIFSQNAYRISTGKRISLLRKLPDGNLVAFSGRKAFYITPNSITELLGPTGNSAFNAGDDNSIVSADFFNDQLHATSDALAYPIKIFIDGNNTPQLRTAGLPKLATDPSVSMPTGSASYVYAFTYYVEYFVGGTLFADESAPIYVNKTGVLNASISGIPALSNGSGFNYDTANIKVRIYRTLANGTVFYYVGQISNGSSSFTDTFSDATIQNNPGLYTNGGILPNDAPTPAKYIFECNDTYYYLNHQGKPFRLKQSITNDPDSVPESFFSDFKAAIKGGAGVGRSPIILTENQVVRLDGILDETGQGLIQREIISHTVGGISQGSLVKTSKGLYFAGTDGFYFTDGFSTPTKLAKKDSFSSKIDITYRKLIATEQQKSRIQGRYDALNNRVYWTVQESDSDNDKIYVYDETHDAFSSISNNGGIRPTALEIIGDSIIIGDSKGYIFKMSADFFTHPIVNVDTTPDQWIETPIVYSFKSVHLDAGDSSLNKWWRSINVQGNPSTNVDMAIKSYTNGEDAFKSLYPIRISPSIVWGDPTFTWGNDSFVWDRFSSLNQTRKFAAGRLRARHRQIEFTNSYFKLASNTEELNSYVNVNSASNMAILQRPDLYSFGLNNEGYDLIIQGKAYRIISGTEDTLLVDDSEESLPTGSFPWEIRGVAKGQRTHILNFSMEFEMLSDAGTQLRSESA